MPFGIVEIDQVDRAHPGFDKWNMIVVNRKTRPIDKLVLIARFRGDRPTQEERAAARRRVLEYNEDDVRATWHVREWMEKLDASPQIDPA